MAKGIEICKKCGNTTFKVNVGKSFVEWICSKCNHEDYAEF